MPEFVVTAESVGAALGVEYGCPYVLTGPDGTRVVFNDDTDEDFIGILSPESSGLDAPDVREDATDATEEDGGHHGDFFEGRRPVVLQGTIIATSAKQRNERVAKLKRASRALRRDATLEWEPSGGAKVELKLRRQQPLRVTKGYVKDFQVGMVAADPFPKGRAVHFNGGNNALITGLSSPRDVAVDSTYIYYADESIGAIGRAKLDGTEPNNKFIEAPVGPHGVDVNATYIYWADKTAQTIGRAKLDGTEPNNEFITAPSAPRGCAIDSTYIYWTSNPTGTIGRAKLDGTEPNNEFIKGLSLGGNVAVDSTYIYWSDITAKTIGRAKLDGTEPNNKFISVPGQVYGVVVNSTYIYWTDATNKTIGRANLDGTEPNNEFILLTNESRGTTVNATYIYWGELTTKSVGRAPLGQSSPTNAGDAPAYPTIKIYGPGSTFKLENATTEEFILLEGVELKEGEYFEIDFKNHTIKKNGTTYAYNALVFASSNWWALEPGKNNIVVTGGTAEVEWQDTYI